MEIKEKEYMIMVCCGVHCTEAKSISIRSKIEEEVNKHNLKNKVFIFYVGCFGLCQRGPVVEIIDPYYIKTTYINVKIEDVESLIESHLINHKLFEKNLLKD